MENKITLEASISITVQEKNTYVLALFAKSIWWHDAMWVEPQDYILAFIKRELGKTRGITEKTLREYHGEIWKDTVDQVMKDFDDSVKISTKIIIWSPSWL